MSGFRYGIGVDYFYSDTRTLNFQREGFDVPFDEPFLNLISKIIISLSLPNQVFFIFLSLITIACYIISIFISDEQNYLFQFFVLIFYCIFFNSLNQSRNGTSIALGLLAFAIVLNCKKKWYFIILSLLVSCLSILFHNSGIINIAIVIIYLLFYFFNKRLKNKNLIVTYTCIIAISPLIFVLLYFTIDKIPILNNFAYFFSYDFDSTGTPLVKFLAGFFSFSIPMIGFVFYLLNFVNTEDYFMKFIGFILFLNMIFMTFGVLINSLLLSDRLKSTLYFLELFIVPYMFSKLPKENQRYIYGGLVSFIMIAVFFSSQTSNGTYPYRSLFGIDFYIY
ncbi:MAG: EpsG family protein [Firmicutes bacterium]|uniref:EpsG family protein n=1 Tax=Candidatus Onthovivens merdipullorum TaxID=2840889 RepID=A0A9D9DKR3_9BACL|nr:EpsG family protein [Candidatus Onthovivens merdipullorum]